MVFYGSCFIGKIAHFLHPRIIFQRAADLLHSTRSDCFTPILKIKKFSLNIWRGFILVIYIIIGLGGFREELALFPNPLTSVYILRKFCIIKHVFLPGKDQLELSFLTWETATLCVC